jgi:hypothetical protein
MEQGLLGGVLPAIYSGADQLKRGVYGLLTDPMEQVKRAGQSLLQSRADRQALMARTFANPERPFQVTDQAGLSQLTDQVMSGELGFAPAGITAFHGTPHNILGKFDASKIGTGEGAQAYGHGMYFAEAPSVAETYKKAGSELKLDFGKPLQELNISPYITTHNLDFDSPLNAALSRISKRIRTDALDNPNLPVDKSLVKEQFDNYINMLDDKYVADVAQKNALQELIKKEGYPEPSFGGNLYKVDIPDEYVPTMMNWDKPLGEQSAFVKKAINSLKKQVTPEMKMELGDDLNLLFGKDITPAQFLNTWEIIHPTGGVGIGEKLLNEQGVKGIRYLDNQSRDAGKGTSNFVVFDPTDVKILERNNQPIEGLLD